MNQPKETFPNKKEARIIIGFIVFAFVYFLLIGPYFKVKQYCVKQVVYKPAGSYSFGNNESEHYVGYLGKKFKTYNEAIKNCIGNKNEIKKYNF